MHSSITWVCSQEIESVNSKEWLYNVYTPVSRGLYEEGIVNISGFELKSKMLVVQLEEEFQEFQEIQDANAVDS